MHMYLQVRSKNITRFAAMYVCVAAQGKKTYESPNDSGTCEPLDLLSQ